MTNLLIGIILMFFAQIGTFVQLQGNAKYNWYDSYPYMLLLFSIPLSWLYIKSVKHIILAFNGQLWPSRLLGFGVGIFVFAIMSYILFKEPITIKTILSLVLALAIILIQILMK